MRGDLGCRMHESFIEASNQLGTSSVHDGIGPTFEGAVPPLSCILVLVVRF